ncbi:MAG: DNA recombination protein RmuC [Wenzhouxiangellaceae bacterium]
MIDWPALLALAQTLPGLVLLSAGALTVALMWAAVAAYRRRQWRDEQAARLAELAELQDHLRHNEWQLETALAARQSAQEEIGRIRGEVVSLREQNLNSERQRAELNARLESERRHFSEQKNQLQAAETRLTDTFKRLAGEIFDDKTRRFNELSQERLGQLLNPVQGQLKDFGKLVQDTHQQEMARHAVLEKELLQLRDMNHRLSDEAHHLVDALRGDVKVMGAWGEFKLERLLTLAGLDPRHEFDLQYTAKDSQGNTLRPDAVVWLPDNKCIIIDAKVSLEDYRLFRAADEDNERQAALKRHIQSLRQHMRGLGQRDYQNLTSLKSPNFVLMFVPSEPAYLDALQADEGLLTEAQKHNVVILSPANLLATLRTVASLWHAWRQNENALAIANRAGLLYDKFVGFSESLREIGMRLDQAQAAYEKSFNQLSRGAGNLVRQTEQLRQLGARASKQLDTELLDDDDSLPELEQRPDEADDE